MSPADILAGVAMTVIYHPWVCSFFQKARKTDTACGVCGQTREAHLARDRRRGAQG